jgi:DNA-binding transcriptional LysR family regulator
MDDALFPVAAPSLPGIAGIGAPGDLLAFPLLSDLALQGWPEWFRAAGLRAQRLPDMHMFDDSTDVMRAAAAGLGIGLARRHIAAPYLQRGELQRLPGPVLKTRFAYYAVHPAHRRPRAPAAAFLQWLQEEARATTAEPLRPDGGT